MAKFCDCNNYSLSLSETYTGVLPIYYQRELRSSCAVYSSIPSLNLTL
jgi:hypothetical protein